MAKTTLTMPLVAALETLCDARGDRVVITSMGAAREWPRLSQHPLDFHYIPSTMGGAIPLALGLALAQPHREFIVLTGDGSLLMSLGSLITVAASGATNLTIVLMNNAVYEVTGGQTTAAAQAGIAFGKLAADSGIRSVRMFETLASWQSDVAAALNLPGPRFIELRTTPVQDNYRLESPGPVATRLIAFREAMKRTP
jgi:thiamine pyrophosphate-dependent acetolactate synthase large subunit-like protein